MGQLQRVTDELKRSGWRIVALGADAPATLASVTEKAAVEYTLLSDQDLVASTAYGVAFALDDETVASYAEYGIELVDSRGRPRPALPVPAVFLVDDEGIVRFQHADPDYKRRLDPDVLLAAARSVTR